MYINKSLEKQWYNLNNIVSRKLLSCNRPNSVVLLYVEVLDKNSKWVYYWTNLVKRFIKFYVLPCVKYLFLLRITFNTYTITFLPFAITSLFSLCKPLRVILMIYYLYVWLRCLHRALLCRFLKVIFSVSADKISIYWCRCCWI